MFKEPIIITKAPKTSPTLPTVEKMIIPAHLHFVFAFPAMSLHFHRRRVKLVPTFWLHVRQNGVSVAFLRILIRRPLRRNGRKGFSQVTT